MELENKETWNYKKIQRKVNKIVRKLNKQIEDDELWKGRFYIRQVKRYMKPYDDMSGIDDAFLFEMYDKKTGMKHLSNGWYSYFALKTFNKLAWDLNNFIVDICKVWQEDPRPNINNAIDYRNKK